MMMMSVQHYYGRPDATLQANFTRAAHPRWPARSTPEDLSISCPHRNMRIFTALLILSVFAACDSAPVEDLVESLPGYGAPPSTMYSGFLNASAADPVAAVQLHYIFTQTTRSDIKATEAPVVLWLNGALGHPRFWAWWKSGVHLF